MTSGRPALLLIACVASSCSARPELQDLGGAYDWLPLQQGKYWRGVAHAGEARTTTNYRVNGGDVRTLDGVRVDYRFVFGTPLGSDHIMQKWIYALPDSGPREFYVDAGVWSAEFDPPVAVLPSDVEEGATWEWTGAWSLDHEEAEARSTLAVTGLEDIRFAGEERVTLRVTQEFESGARIDRWFARGIGMVRMTVEGRGPRRSIEHAALEPGRRSP